LEKQYAIYVCGNQYLEPPATYFAEPFALEGGRIVGYLKDKLSRASDDGTIRDVVSVLWSRLGIAEQQVAFDSDHTTR